MATLPDYAHWYEVCEGEDVLQGDLVPGCPVFQPTEAMDGAQEGLTYEADLVEADLAILSQSCDLEAQKVATVLGAAYVAWTDAAVEQAFKNNKEQKRFREKLVRGEFPSLSLLHEHSGEPVLPWTIVDFRKLYVVPLGVLRSHALGVGPRLRLVPPYREHLAQGFARYMMRVGLPVEARAFEDHPAV